jgi:Tfp pilus assembly protein PilN
METNGNGWLKPIMIGVAIVVLSTVVVGAGGGTIQNTITNHEQQVQVDALKSQVDEQRQSIAKIPVMDERVKGIQEDVRDILDALKKEK